jgi:hypothetical protein
MSLLSSKVMAHSAAEDSPSACVKSFEDFREFSVDFQGLSQKGLEDTV